MTFLNANLPSEDEEDSDFVPSEVDEEGAARKPAKKRKTVRGAAIGATAGVDDDDEEHEDEQKDADDDVPEHKKAAKKAKMDELWSNLNSKASAAPTAKPAGINLATLCKPVEKKKQGVDQSWQRQLGLLPKIVTTTGASEASKSEADKKAAAANALAAAKLAASATAAQQYGMVSVTETRRFAGKNITMTKQVAADSKEAAKATATNGGGQQSEAEAAAQKKQAGLDAVLASLAQAKKVGVLDKSRADWKDFKKDNEVIDEELETHKRSGGGYLEKQAFLGRAELNEYEKERDARLQSDVRNRGRL